MKSASWKKIIPHIIALVVFLLVSVIFCKDSLKPDTVLNQHDVAGWQGMSHQSFEYKDKKGHFPLWATSMFSGMPAVQIAVEGSWVPTGLINNFLVNTLPQPINFFFLACLSFYIFCLCIKVNPYAAIVFSVAFAFSTYYPIFIMAGHNTQVTAIAMCPAAIGGAILIWQKKYLLGFALSVLFLYLQIVQGHQQVSYYLMLILLIMGISYTVLYIKAKDYSSLVKSAALLIVAGVIAVLANAVTLFPTYDYAKESKRGGELILDKKDDKVDKTNDDGKTKGLSIEYAFQWSYGRAELLSVMFPGVKSYGTHVAQRDGEVYYFPKLKDNSKAVESISSKLSLDDNQKTQVQDELSTELYWGDQPFTSGPAYFGAIFCFMFIIGLFIADKQYKWWMLAASVLGMLLSLGYNLAWFNNFMFNYFPFYNKFRVPTMALVIPEILVPMLGVLGLQKIINTPDKKTLFPAYKKALLTTAAVIVVALAVYASATYTNQNTSRSTAFSKMLSDSTSGQNIQTAYEKLNQEYPPKKDNQLVETWFMRLQSAGSEALGISKNILQGLEQDRKSIYFNSFLKSFFFVLIIAALLWVYFRKPQSFSFWIVLGAIALLGLGDLIGLASKYLNKYNYTEKSNYDNSEFPLSSADEQILKDTSAGYRVFDLTNGDPFQESKTSYYHNAIGGYHPAKLGIYDDLIKYQLAGNPNHQVLNMLNTKYVINYNEDKSQKVAQINPQALGNAWFVNHVQFVNTSADEMKALYALNTADSAVANNSYKDILAGTVAKDSLASIKLVHYDNDTLFYQTSTNAPHTAVFSEIFYKDWKAYMDGNEVPIAKVNYVLRGLKVPAGKHTIQFVFEPKVFFTSNKISVIFSWIIIVILAWATYDYFKQKETL